MATQGPESDGMTQPVVPNRRPRRRGSETQKNGRREATPPADVPDFDNKVFDLEASVAHIMISDGPYAGLELYASLEITVAAYLELECLRSKPSQAPELLSLFGDAFLDRWNLHRSGEPVPADAEGMKTLPLTLGMQIIGQWIEAAVDVAPPLDGISADGEPSPARMTSLAESSESL